MQPLTAISVRLSGNRKYLSSGPGKSFNRSFTHYFLDTRKPAGIASLMTPKSLGEIISNYDRLNNGDGISWFTPQRENTVARSSTECSTDV